MYGRNPNTGPFRREFLWMAPTSHTRTMSAEFDSLDTILGEEVDRIAALASENATLRKLLADRDADPIPLSPDELADVDAVQLRRELATARLAQEEMKRELAALRSAQKTVAAAAIEDRADEFAFLRQSLATLAEQLEAEKLSVVEHEERQRAEEEKVSMLRTKVEESRRALMRIQGETSRKNSTCDSLSVASARRASQGGLFETTTRRRSSFGLPPPGGLGLGFESSSTRSNVARQSMSHRRGSASLSGIETPGEEDRMARLRDLRYGNTTIKCSSRRNSAVNGNDFAGDVDYEPARHRIPSFSYPSSLSIDEEGQHVLDPISRPPSAPLRFAGRKNSTAVFDNWSRRSSLDSYGQDPILGGAPYIERSNSTGASPSMAEIMYELDGLRVQLAESEEGRRASEHCLKALKDFIASPRSSHDGELEGVRLPPLPTDADADDVAFSATNTNQKRSSVSRWAMPRLPSLRRESAGSPNLTTFASNPRRVSASSTASSTTYADMPTHTAAAPIFGGFSFSRVVSAPVRSTPLYDDENTSPTMAAAESFRTTRKPEESDSETHAPSLTDSSASSESSRSSSPTADSEYSPILSDNLVKICEDNFSSPERVVVPSVLVEGKALLSPIGEAPSFQFGVMP